MEEEFLDRLEVANEVADDGAIDDVLVGPVVLESSWAVTNLKRCGSRRLRALRTAMARPRMTFWNSMKTLV